MRSNRAAGVTHPTETGSLLSWNISDVKLSNNNCSPREKSLNSSVSSKRVKIVAGGGNAKPVKCFYYLRTLTDENNNFEREEEDDEVQNPAVKEF